MYILIIDNSYTLHIAMHTDHTVRYSERPFHTLHSPLPLPLSSIHQLHTVLTSSESSTVDRPVLVAGLCGSSNVYIIIIMHAVIFT